MCRTLVILLTCLVTVTLAQLPGLGPCPVVTTKDDFDLDRYLGKWYEVARYHPIFFEFASKCTTAQYSLKENQNILVNNTGIKYATGESDTEIGEANVFDPSQNTGALQVRFGDFAPSDANYLVLDTDYDSFSIVWSCNSLASLVRLDTLWLLGRQPTIPEETLDGIMALLTSFNIRTEYLKFGEHDCGI